MSEVIAELRGSVGCLTLNRPRALNALSLGMVRELAAALLAWRDDPAVHAVAFRGMGREQPFGAFCAGGDIRFFHQAALAGDPQLEDFFTEEYALDHLVHRYPKPTVVFADGIVMGGGMGIAQGCRLRIATARTKMAMPETNIGLFPDVAGGYFLSRCPGRVGEYLALTGTVVGGAEAAAVGLADAVVAPDRLTALWDALADFEGFGRPGWQAALLAAPADGGGGAGAWPDRARIDAAFGAPTLAGILAAVQRDDSDWGRATAAALRQRSPLMLHVTLEQVRRARSMALADELRMERGMVRRCFSLRPGAASETAEGIRALAIDKDHSPRWNPGRIEDVEPAQVQAFFASPWPAHAHPLRMLD